MEERRSERRLEERGLSDILNETFIIYGQNFLKFVGLVAILEVPVVLPAFLPIDSRELFIFLNVLQIVALVLAYGAAISAVGQHYVAQNVSVSGCYSRVLWRLISMMILAAIPAISILVGVVLTEISGLIVVPAILLVILVVCGMYMTVAAPAVVIEGYRSLNALGRGFELARFDEGRLLGNLVVYSLVTFGLAIVLILPFVIVSIGSSPDELTFSGRMVLLIGSAFVSVVVPPVWFIASTLLYLDLRVRKEGLDLTRLSQEMGVATV